MGGIEPHYISADTAPKGFAVRRSLWVAPSFNLAVVATAAATALLLQPMTSLYARLIGGPAGVDPTTLATGGSLAFRPFFVIIPVLIAVFAVGTLRQRLKFAVTCCALNVGAVMLLDLALARAMAFGGPSPFSLIGGVLVLALGLIVFVVTVFWFYHLPPRVEVGNPLWRRSRRYALILGGCLAVATLVLLEVHGEWAEIRRLPLPPIGGLAPGSTLFLLTLIALLFGLSVAEQRLAYRRRPALGTNPPLTVAFLVPAHNEVFGIAECIRSLDAAAANYAGHCQLYLVDNLSTDDTVAVAETALVACQHLTGSVLHCPQPGKAYALNFGVAAMTEDVILRVDADTIVSPYILPAALPWFQDPTVGGVGGLALPKGRFSWFARMRVMEVYYNIGFLRRAQGAIESVMTIPGMLAAYRRAAVAELGGFGEGFNGEDGDMTLRLARTGYRIITDPRVQALTEVPDNFMQLREQRQRWSRSLYHVANRNMSMIWMRQGVRGLILLPWAILNSIRRALTLPLLLGAITVELLHPAVFSLRSLSVAGGTIAGLQLVLIAIMLIGHRRLSLIPWIPTYFVYHFILAYFALESLLTLRMKGRG